MTANRQLRHPIGRTTHLEHHRPSSRQDGARRRGRYRPACYSARRTWRIGSRFRTQRDIAWHGDRERSARPRPLAWATNRSSPTNLGTFDLVLCCLVLSHVEDLCLAVRTLSRFVAPGGRLILTDFHPFNLMIGWRTGFNHDGRRYAVPNYLHLPSQYFRAIQATGLTVEDFLEVGGFPNMPDQPATLIVTGRRV